MVYKLKIVTSIIAISCSLTGFSQNNIVATDNFFVHNQANGTGIALHQNKLFSKKAGVLSTAKDFGNDTQILFSDASTWEGASSDSYVDGFVKSNHNKAFIFPIGSGGHFKPIACSKSKGVIAAYFSGDSSFDVEEANTGITLINKSSYWVVQHGSPTHLTLSWDKNDEVASITGNDISKLKILGFDGYKWSAINSKVEPFALDTKTSTKNFSKIPSSSNNGAISTTNEIILNTYLAYAIGVVDVTKINKVAKKKTAERATVSVPKAVRNTAIVSETIDLSSYGKLKSVHFPFKESKVTRFSTHLLQSVAKKLKGTNPRIRLVGHADFYGSQEYNYQLGLDRANAVKEMLSKFGLNSIEVDIESNGEYLLEKNCETKNCSTKETLIDRRVDIYVYKY